MDIRLHYIEKGSGFPLILLHGNGESGEYFTSQIEYFSKDHRVIAVDTRGHGKSPRGTAPFTLEQFADDLKYFLDSMQISKADILGFSDGGNIALIFALKYPKIANKLILNGANLSPAGVKLSEQLPICFEYIRAAFISLFDGKSILKRELLNLMVTRPNIKCKDLNRIQNSTLVIVGTNDMIREKHSRIIAKAIPNAKIRILTGDHFIAANESEAFNAAVDIFLKG